jgi:hypothetical protein
MIKGHVWLCASLTLALLLSTFGMAAAGELAKPNKLNPYTGDPGGDQTGPDALPADRLLWLSRGWRRRGHGPSPSG